MADKTSPEYAMLPAGTVVKWGAVGAAAATLKALTNCKAVGEMGQTGSFVDCTTLIDTTKQFISDLPEGAGAGIRHGKTSCRSVYPSSPGLQQNQSVKHPGGRDPLRHRKPVAIAATIIKRETLWLIKLRQNTPCFRLVLL